MCGVLILCVFSPTYLPGLLPDMIGGGGIVIQSPLSLHPSDPTSDGGLVLVGGDIHAASRLPHLYMTCFALLYPTEGSLGLVFLQLSLSLSTACLSHLSMKNKKKINLITGWWHHAYLLPAHSGLLQLTNNHILRFFSKKKGICAWWPSAITFSLFCNVCLYLNNSHLLLLLFLFLFLSLLFLSSPLSPDDGLG